jgi:hypothetical protein
MRKMILNIHLVPSASKNEIVGWHDGALKIRIASPPVEGKANEELIRFLAKQLDLAPSEITIVGGLASKRKRVEIPLHEDDVKKVLAI